MSTAEVIAFPGQQPPQPTEKTKEVRVADCDDGYTRIANELLDAVLQADLTVRQLKIVMAVIRKTYGFNKKTDRITNTQIAASTGIHHTHVCKAKIELLERKILVTNGREIGVNKVVSKWKNEISQNSKTLAKSANAIVPSQLNTKDTLKDKKDKEILKDITPSAQKSVSKKQESSPAKQTVTELDYSSWPAMPSEQVMTDWKAMRQAKGKKAAITQTVINTIGKQLTIATQHGLTVDDCLSECCTRNWQGFKAEWMVESLKQKPAAKQSIRQNGFTHTGEPYAYVGKL